MNSQQFIPIPVNSENRVLPLPRAWNALLSAKSFRGDFRHVLVHHLGFFQAFFLEFFEAFFLAFFEAFFEAFFKAFFEAFFKAAWV